MTRTDKRFFLAIVGILFLAAWLALDAHGQVIDCTNTVTDYAQVLNGSAVLDAARPLANEGADVRVVTINSGMMAADGTVDNVIARIQRSCVTWQSPNHGIKSNLLVLAVAPKERKMAILYAKDGTLTKALAGHDDRIKNSFMAPYFKTGDWAAGLIAGEQQLRKRLAAAQDETLHPQVSTTVNQAADLSGLWTVLKWLLFFTGVGLLCWVCIWLVRKVEEAKKEILKAQTRAVAAKNAAARAIQGLISDPTISTTKAAIDLDKEFSRLSSMEMMNPDAPGFAADQYKAMATEYEELARKVSDLHYPAPAYSSVSSGSMPEPTDHAHHRDYRPKPKPGYKKPHEPPVQQRQQGPYEPQAQSPSVFVNETTIIEREPQRALEPEPVRSYESPSTSGWGGSSSDSSSSSSESGGSSSDFGSSSSSDFGGSSSDF